jgi:hypothetical protein
MFLFFLFCFLFSNLVGVYSGSVCHMVSTDGFSLVFRLISLPPSVNSVSSCYPPCAISVDDYDGWLTGSGKR